LVVGEEAVVAVGGLVALLVAAAAASAAVGKGNIVDLAGIEGFVELYMEDTGLVEDVPLVGNVVGLVVDENPRNPVRLAEVSVTGLLKLLGVT
jgi:hypothetical protein